MISPEDWQEFENKHDLFVMDAERKLDQTRQDAMAACRDRHGDLVAIETEEEMAFLKRRIKIQETKIGQASLNDQWWTSGVAYMGEWIWENGDHMPSKYLCFQEKYNVYYLRENWC